MSAGSSPAARIASAKRTPSASRALEQRGVEPAEEGAACEETRLEARALLVGEGHDLDREREPLPAAIQSAPRRRRE